MFTFRKQFLWKTCYGTQSIKYLRLGSSSYYGTQRVMCLLLGSSSSRRLIMVHKGLCLLLGSSSSRILITEHKGLCIYFQEVVPIEDLLWYTKGYVSTFRKQFQQKTYYGTQRIRRSSRLMFASLIRTMYLQLAQCLRYVQT